MKKSFILYVALLFLFGCKWEIPAEEKTLKSCQKPTGILATPDAINPKKFSFSLVGALAEVASVSWKVSTGNTTLVQAANANAQAYGYTVATDGTYVVTADVTTTCQDKTTLSVTYTVNTQLPVASSFSLTDPMVHSRLTAVAVANDGTLMAVENSEIKVWNPTTRTLIRTLKADVNPINTVALSPSEAYLVAADNTGKIYVWDWKSGTLTRTLTGHTNAVYKVRVSTDGKYIASLSADKTIRVWDTSTWQSIRTIAFSDNSSIPNAFAVNSSGNYVAGCFYSGNTYYFVMWNFQTGSEVWRQTISYPYGLEFSPDGQQLYLNYYGTSYKYQLWNTATKQLTKEVEGDYLLSLSLDGRYILSNYSWLDTQTFSRSWSKTLLGFSPNYIAISANNQYAARSSYGYVEVLQTSNGTPLSSTFSKHPTLVTSASFSKDNRILAILDYAGLVKTWDMTTGQMLASQTTQNYYTGGNGVALTPDSKYLIISGCSNLYRILNSTDGSLVKTIASSNCSNETVISPDGSFFVSGSGNNVVIRETSTGNTLKTLVGHTGTVNAIAVSPDNKTVSSFGNDYIIRIWDVATGTLLRNISTNNIYISNLAISPDGQYLVGTGGNYLYVWNYATATPASTPSWNAMGTYSINATAYSPDGSLLASGTFDGKLKIWNMPSGTQFKEVSLAYPIRKIQFSADGKQAYVVTEKDVQILTVK